MSTYYQTLKDERKRLARLLDCPLREGRGGIEYLLKETTTAIAQLERGEHWTQTSELFGSDLDWKDEQDTRESVRPL